MRWQFLLSCSLILAMQLFITVAEAQPFAKKGEELESYTVSLKNRGLDNEMTHLLDVLPLFLLQTDSVIQPIDMSSDYPGMSLNSYQIILPSALIAINADSTQGFKKKLVWPGLAYGFANHNHGKGLFPNHTLILVEKTPTMRYRKTRVWVDMNHNLDLTDDPIQYYIPSAVGFSTKLIPNEINLLRLDSLNFGVSLQLGYFQGNEFKSYQKLYADAVNLVKGNRSFLGVASSFRQRRLNVICGSSVVAGDTINWALKDVNLNGEYNDNGIDVVMVSENSGDFNSANAWTLNKDEVVLDWLGQGWKIEPLKESNWGLKIIAISNKLVKNSRSLLIGDKIPNFKFCVIEGEYRMGKLKENPVHRRKIRKFKGKNTLVVVWNADDMNFHKDSAALHALGRNLPENWQIIMLNHGGSGRYVYGYNRRFETKVIQGFCSPQVTELLKLQTMPQTFLLDENQRLIAINMSPFEIQGRINGTLR